MSIIIGLWPIIIIFQDLDYRTSNFHSSHLLSPPCSFPLPLVFQLIVFFFPNPNNSLLSFIFPFPVFGIFLPYHILAIILSSIPFSSRSASYSILFFFFRSFSSLQFSPSHSFPSHSSTSSSSSLHAIHNMSFWFLSISLALNHGHVEVGGSIFPPLDFGIFY